MNKSILKQKLIDQIHLIDDKDILNQIEKYISFNLSKEKIYQLNEDDIEAIKLSDIEIDRGEFISNSDLQKKINSWL